MNEQIREGASAPSYIFQSVEDLPDWMKTEEKPSLKYDPQIKRLNSDRIKALKAFYGSRARSICLNALNLQMTRENPLTDKYCRGNKRIFDLSYSSRSREVTKTERWDAEEGCPPSYERVHRGGRYICRAVPNEQGICPPGTHKDGDLCKETLTGGGHVVRGISVKWMDELSKKVQEAHESEAQTIGALAANAIQTGDQIVNEIDNLLGEDINNANYYHEELARLANEFRNKVSFSPQRAITEERRSELTKNLVKIRQAEKAARVVETDKGTFSQISLNNMFKQAGLGGPIACDQLQRLNDLGDELLKARTGELGYLEEGRKYIRDVQERWERGDCGTTGEAAEKAKVLGGGQE